MGTDISPGLVLVDGTLVHDADFNALVANSTILPTAISAKTLKPEMSLGDEFLVNDGGVLKKVTGQQIITITKLPAGVMMDYAGTTEPLGWAFCYGQELNRITYADLYAAIGDEWGDGDGSTTFNVPDFRGRVSAGKDDMGGTAANRLTTAKSGVDGKTLGAIGGVEEHKLTGAESGQNVPAHSHTVASHTHSMAHTHTIQPHHHNASQAGGVAATNANFGSQFGFSAQATSNNIGGSVTDGASPGTTGGSGTLTTDTEAAVTADATNAHKNVQPTAIVNKIIKT